MTTYFTIFILSTAAVFEIQASVASALLSGADGVLEIARRFAPVAKKKFKLLKEVDPDDVASDIASTIDIHMERVLGALGLSRGASDQELIDAIDRLEIDQGDIAAKRRVLTYFLSHSADDIRSSQREFENFFPGAQRLRPPKLPQRRCG